jgi:tetratricopeptide (TPR) repeat protein
MHIKEQGEKIKRSYQVISVFPFVDGVLYYTAYDSFDPEEVPTRFIHAIELPVVPDEKMLAQLPLRNEDVFVPLQEVFVEDGVLYQVFEKLEGNLLGIYLYQNAPLALGEISHMVREIADHWQACEANNQFVLIDPQNMVIHNDKIRFLYGGSSSIFATGKASAYSEAEVSKQMTELLFHMLTGELLEEHVNEVRPLQAFRSDVPVELESWMMKSLSPDPQMRPALQDLWDWANEHGGKKPASIEEKTKKQKSSNPFLDKLTPPKPKLGSFGKKKEEKSKEKQSLKPKKKMPGWVMWAALGVIGLVFLAQLLFAPGPDITPLVQAKVIQEVEQDEDKAINLYNQSVKSYESKDITKAIALAKQALATDTENKQYYIHLANLFGLQKDYKSGLIVLQVATSYFTDDAKLFDQYAVFAYYERDYEKAKQAVDKAVSLDENLASAHYHRGKIYSVLKDLKIAVTSMKTAVAKDQKNALYLHDAALVYLQAGEVDNAVKSEKKAVDLEGKNSEYRITLGLLYLKQRDEILRNQSLKESVKAKRLKELLDNSHRQFRYVTDTLKDKEYIAEAYYYKARTYYIYGKQDPKGYENAITSSKNAVFYDPKNALYLYQLGICYMAVNNKAAAVDALQKAVNLDPRNRLYQNGLASAQAMK